jgi:hypothetical protein
MKDYKIVIGCDESAIEKNVNEYLEKGYIPMGGVAFYNYGGFKGSSYNGFYQAVVKLEPGDLGYNGSRV